MITWPTKLTPTCSRCGKEIPSEDINVANDIAYCRSCNISHSLSALVHGTELDEQVDVNNPPAGAWYRNDGIATVVGATHRSVGGAIAALLVGLFWNGIVSIFVVFAVAGTLQNLDVRLPHWFPAPDMNGSPMSVGMTIFLWLFLTPFIAIGLGMIFAFFSSIAGRTEVRVENAQGTIFVGVGALGYRRRFERDQVKDVRIDEQNWRDSDGDRRRKTLIVLETEAGKTLKFGSMLSAERRKFVASACKKALSG